MCANLCPQISNTCLMCACEPLLHSFLCWPVLRIQPSAAQSHMSFSTPTLLYARLLVDARRCCLSAVCSNGKGWCACIPLPSVSLDRRPGTRVACIQASPFPPQRPVSDLHVQVAFFHTAGGMRRMESWLMARLAKSHLPTQTR